MFAVIVDYINQGPGQTYNLIIGTDSFLNSSTLFVSAVIIHRVGHGGRYFYKKTPRRKMDNLKQRIFFEAAMSIELASIIKTRLDESGLQKLPVEIHLDVFGREYVDCEDSGSQYHAVGEACFADGCGYEGRDERSPRDPGRGKGVYPAFMGRAYHIDAVSDVFLCP